MSAVLASVSTLLCDELWIKNETCFRPVKVCEAENRRKPAVKQESVCNEASDAPERSGASCWEMSG